MAKPPLVRLRRRWVRVRWKCKSRGVVKVKRYLRWWLQIPAGLDVSDLVGLPLRVWREGERIIFEPVRDNS